MSAGATMQTWSGRTWDLLSPRAEDVCWDDIVQPLARATRYNGHHKPDLYSVAEHSCHVSDYLAETGNGPLMQMAGLLHDAHEAYLGDAIAPLSRAITTMVPEYATAWNTLTYAHDSAIAAFATHGTCADWSQLFNLLNCLRDAGSGSTYLHNADLALRATEKAQLLHSTPPWPGLPEPWRRDGRMVVLPCWRVQRAVREMTQRFERLREELTR